MANKHVLSPPLPVVLLLQISIAIRLKISTSPSRRKLASRNLNHRSRHLEMRAGGLGKEAALDEFRAAFAPESKDIIEGTAPIHCGTYKYFGPVEGIGGGAHGVTILMHRDSRNGAEVVLKLWKGSEYTPEENLNNECDVLQALERHGVPNVVNCEARCLLNSRQVIVVSPFERDVQAFDGPMIMDFFSSKEAVRKAVEDTLYIAWSMLEAGVVNIDQGQNILYARHGSVRFIDMGLANKLVELPKDDDKRIFDCVDTFLKSILGKVPFEYWKDDGAPVFEIIEKLGLPVLPSEVKQQIDIDFAELILAIFIEKIDR